MVKMLRRIQKQVDGRTASYRRPRISVHTMVNQLLAYCLEVDAHMRIEGDPSPDQVNALLEAGEQLRKDAEQWLGA